MSIRLKNIETIKNYFHSDKSKMVEELYSNNKRLVGSYAKRYKKYANYEDLFQVGCIGLVTAANRFDPSLGFEFSTYAGSLIIGEIKRYLREGNSNTGMVRVARHIRDQMFKLSKIEKEHIKKTGSYIDLKELAEKMEMTVDEVQSVKKTMRDTNVKSLNTVLYKGGATNSGVSLIDKMKDTAVEVEAEAVNKIAIEECLAQLNDKEKEVILLRYFEDQTQPYISKVMNISQAQVSRLEKLALKKMRKFLS